MENNRPITNPILWTSSLGTIYQRGLYTDVNLIVEGKHIPVHCSVLSAISPLFHHLLENKNELQDTTIILAEFRYQPTVMLMNFIYNGTVEGCTDDLMLLTKYAKELNVQGLFNVGCNKGKPLIELLETNSKANSQLEQLKQLENAESGSESEDELCIVFERHGSSSKPDTVVTNHPESSNCGVKSGLKNKQSLSPSSQSVSPVPPKKRTKTLSAASKVAVAGSNTDTSTINKKCSICKELFMTIESHRNHLETVHADLLTCSICNKLFTLRASLRKHLKRHIQSFDGILLGTSVQLTTRTGELAIQPT